MISGKHLNWIVALFLLAVVAIVFQQISTSMTEQGIATGGPYDNGAAYPRAVAIVIAALVILQLLFTAFAKIENEEIQATSVIQLKRPASVLLVFSIYVAALTTLGYHLTTTPMIFALMWVCGARNILKQAVAAIVMAFAFAYIFEKILNVVLPGGMYALNIPW
jgi:putative tricarboxylic transport membrane protein